MGRPRKPLSWKPEGRSFVTYFLHPVLHNTEPVKKRKAVCKAERRTGKRKKPMRIVLGQDPGTADRALSFLNEIFLHPEYWQAPPEHIPQELREAWLGSTPREEVGWDPKKPEIVTYSDEQLPVTKETVLRLAADLLTTRGERDRALEKIRALQKEIAHWRGRKLRTNEPQAALQKAMEAWLKGYTGRDSDHMKIVGYDLKRFVRDFAGRFPFMDSLDGRERDIDAWLRGLKTHQGAAIKASRRQQIRRHVLRFLLDSGVALERKAVAPVTRLELRRDRGQIRWLTKEQAEALADKLAQPWQDLFRVQMGLGLRPDELLTLQRENFGPEVATVTLAPLGHLTLKQGTRTISVPVQTRAIIKRRLEAGEIVFPEPETGRPWKDPKSYNRRFNGRLTGAASKAGITVKVDCRTGRRTCASILLRSGLSTESVGAILGDNPSTVREHYAAILSPEVDPSAAAI